jgi:hypothetical protein
MPATEAQIAANRKNAEHSTGPKTDEGKEQSRANSYKHGLTGAGIVLPEREAIEAERRTVAFANELQASGDVAVAIVRRVAMLSVRMERCVAFENVTLTQRVRQAEADFVAPEGCDAKLAAKLRDEAGKLALFDPSREATLARQYEKDAERGFFRGLKELRQVEKQIAAAEEANLDAMEEEILGSFSQGEDLIDELDALHPEARIPAPRQGVGMTGPTSRGRVDVPITIGRGR